MKRVAILGSTGSIGTQALDVIARYRERFSVYALSANSNIELLKKQMRLFSPRKVVVMDEESAERLKRPAQNGGIEILIGDAGLRGIASDSNVDILLVALPGIKGLLSIIDALQRGIRVALANKESLVAGGRFISKMKRGKGEIIPIDSEHSAIFQLLSRIDKKSIRRIYLTATGGPFRGKKGSYLKNVELRDVLNHPRWQMGKKVTVDSATMVNKAFEIIEARWLFDLKPDVIDVVIHPQAIVHSLVHIVDGSFLAHLGPTDMRIPIGYSLSYPDRLEDIIRPLSISELGSISFERVSPPFDHPLKIARSIISDNPDNGIIFNAADEIAVESFLARRIKYTDIIPIIDYSMKHIKASGIKTVMDVINFDADIKVFVKNHIEKRY